MDTKTGTSFGPWRSLFWPINRLESKQVLLKTILLFLICCCYSVLRNLKDAVILSLDSGTEIIPFIKVWGMVPGAIAGTWIYTRLCNRFKRDHVFYLAISCFLLFFLVFAFVLYPHHNHLHFHRTADFLTAHLPTGFKGLISMIHHWSFSLFYIISELWASIIMAVLFWGFINDMTKMSQAKRFYGIISIGSNIAPLVGVFFASLFVQKFPYHWGRFQDDVLGQMLANSILFITFCGLLAIYLFGKLIKLRDTQLLHSQDPLVAANKKPKIKLSIRNSLQFISKSKYLTCLTLIVLGYNIAINFTDVLWKYQLKAFFQDPGEMLAHMNKVSMGIGAISTVGAIAFSYLVSRFGWTLTSILTPLMMAGLALVFFVFLFFGSNLAGFSSSILGLTPLALTVYLGSFQNCLSKAGKYSIFDASKELAFLNVSEEIRTKGKAAIDGLANGVGKSGSSLMYQAFLISFGSLSSCTPYIAFLLIFVFSGWFYSIKVVGQAFKKGAQEPAPRPLPVSKPTRAYQTIDQ